MVKKIREPVLVRLGKWMVRRVSMDIRVSYEGKLLTLEFCVFGLVLQTIKFAYPFTITCLRADQPEKGTYSITLNPNEGA